MVKDNNLRNILEVIKAQDDIYLDTEKVFNILGSFTYDNIHIVADYDKTLTDGLSHSSWSLFSRSGIMPEEYVNKRNEYYNYYRPIEIDYSLKEEYRKEKMKEWWGKHLQLLVDYSLSEEMIKNIVVDKQLMKLRDGADEFLHFLKEKNIPLIIISAGIGNFIEEVLKANKLLFDNIYIISNFLRFQNEGIKNFSDNIVHALNKNEHDLSDTIKSKISNRPNCLLLGDGIDDLKMISEEQREQALAVGFLEEKAEDNLKYFRENFDIVCTNNQSLEPITNLIKSL